MKIYVASSFKLIPIVESVVEALEDAGHTITEKWWDRAYKTKDLGLIDTQKLKKIYDDLDPSEFYSKKETSKSYVLDLRGIEDSDAFVFVADYSPKKFTGANIELGYALALGKDCLSVGELENSVMYSGVLKCKTVSSVLECLEKLK